MPVIFYEKLFEYQVFGAVSTVFQFEILLESFLPKGRCLCDRMGMWAACIETNANAVSNCLQMLCQLDV